VGHIGLYEKRRAMEAREEKRLVLKKTIMVPDD
jgi:hypothetical protein